MAENIKDSKFKPYKKVKPFYGVKLREFGWDESFIVKFDGNIKQSSCINSTICTGVVIASDDLNREYKIGDIRYDWILNAFKRIKNNELNAYKRLIKLNKLI